MADFKQAFDLTMVHEGGYSNDLTDYGGETYRGISRIYNPLWDGWKILDKLKDNYLRNSKAASLALNESVQKLYKDKYWDKFQGDLITSQKIANQLFNAGININPRKIRKFLQKALNCLNRNEKLFPNLEIDGVIGQKTIFALNNGVLEKDWPYVLQIIKTLQANHYITRVLERPKQKRFTRGWLNRLKPVQENKHE